ncbi:MAG: hypothetical protein KGL39_30710 [Patescibacteria group bacterium]|nr:hypothetical protein [Patescibacteria group bacterium]
MPRTAVVAPVNEPGRGRRRMRGMELGRVKGGVASRSVRYARDLVSARRDAAAAGSVAHRSAPGIGHALGGAQHFSVSRHLQSVASTDSGISSRQTAPSYQDVSWDFHFAEGNLMFQDRSMSEAERHASMAQAIANARLEGWEPDAAFLGLAGQVVANALTHDEAVALILAQAQAEDSGRRSRV